MSPRSYITSTSKHITHPINKILPSKKLIEGKREEELTKWNRLRTGIGSEEATRRGGAAPSSCEEDGVEGKRSLFGEEGRKRAEDASGTDGWHRWRTRRLRPLLPKLALPLPKWASASVTKSHITFTFVCSKK